jgi:DNA-binding XRE family transcriptional regulator
MSINTKIQNNYLYNGLGFPIILERADFKKIGEKWLLKIDVKKLSEKVIRALPYKPVGLTGAEIRFIRTYFDLSKRKFAEEIKVSHTAVNKWEEYDQERAKIDIHVEIMLRSLVKLKLNEENDFSNFYRGLMDDVRKFSDKTSTEPMKIAG